MTTLDMFLLMVALSAMYGLGLFIGYQLGLHKVSSPKHGTPRINIPDGLFSVRLWDGKVRASQRCTWTVGDRKERCPKNGIYRAEGSPHWFCLEHLEDFENLGARAIEVSQRLMS